MRRAGRGWDCHFLKKSAWRSGTKPWGRGQGWVGEGRRLVSHSAETLWREHGSRLKRSEKARVATAQGAGGEGRGGRRGQGCGQMKGQWTRADTVLSSQ